MKRKTNISHERLTCANYQVAAAVGSAIMIPYQEFTRQVLPPHRCAFLLTYFETEQQFFHGIFMRWRGRREQKWMIPVICWISPICKPNSLMHSRIVCVKKCNCSGPLCICDAIKFHFFGIYIHCVEVHRTSRWKKKWKIVLFQMHCALLLTAYQPVIFNSRGR